MDLPIVQCMNHARQAEQYKMNIHFAICGINYATACINLATPKRMAWYRTPLIIYLAIVYFFSGLIINAIQLITLVTIWPFSRAFYRKLNGNLVQFYWTGKPIYHFLTFQSSSGSPNGGQTFVFVFSVKSPLSLLLEKKRRLHFAITLVISIGCLDGSSHTTMIAWG